MRETRRLKLSAQIATTGPRLGRDSLLHDETSAVWSAAGGANRPADRGSIRRARRNERRKRLLPPRRPAGASSARWMRHCPAVEDELRLRVAPVARGCRRLPRPAHVEDFLAPVRSPCSRGCPTAVGDTSRAGDRHHGLVEQGHPPGELPPGRSGRGPSPVRASATSCGSPEARADPGLPDLRCPGPAAAFGLRTGCAGRRCSAGSPAPQQISCCLP